MNTLSKGLTMAAAAALVALPASAQTGSGSLGLFGHRNEGSELSRSTAPEFELDNSWGGGASLEFWFGGGRQVGLRFDGSYTQHDFHEGLVPPVNANLDEVGVGVYTADANLMFRLWDVEPSTTFVPFLSLGGGSVWFDPADEAEGTWENPDLTWTETQQTWAVTGGIGADAFLSDNVALRLEVRDYYVTDLPFSENESDHNLQFRAGLNFFWGSRDRVSEPGFIQEEVAPEPEPMPEAEPEPEPVTETVSMCVVGDAGQLETVTATRYIDTNRLVVTRSGEEIEFATAYPAEGPDYVKGSGWYVSNGSMRVWLDEDDMGGDLDDELDDAAERMVGDEDADISSLEFVAFGSAGARDAGSLVYVGSVEGTPIYAERNQVSALMPRLRTALSNESDLEVILRSDTELARDFAGMETFYVAVEPGCVFQPISLTTYVRRTRG